MFNSSSGSFVSETFIDIAGIWTNTVKQIAEVNVKLANTTTEASHTVAKACIDAVERSYTAAQKGGQQAVRTAAATVKA